MKIVIGAFFILLASFNISYSQDGYFVSSAGNYINKNSFKTVSFANLDKYKGIYSGASETYESNYTYIIKSNGSTLEILLISAASVDGENCSADTLIYSNVIVENGKFTLEKKSSNYGESSNRNFRFAKVSYKIQGKTINAEGLVIEDFYIFAEKEK